MLYTTVIKLYTVYLGSDAFELGVEGEHRNHAQRRGHAAVPHHQEHMIQRLHQTQRPLRSLSKVNPGCTFTQGA